MKILPYILALSLIASRCPGQEASTGIGHVLTLVSEGRRCLLKPGEEKADLDSALRLAGQAADLSRRIGYLQGIQSAALLTGNIYVEAKQWPMAWTVYSSLNDTGRIDLLSIMINYRIFTRTSIHADLDSAVACVGLLSTLVSSNAAKGWSLVDGKGQRAAVEKLVFTGNAFLGANQPEIAVRIYLLASRLNRDLLQHDSHPEGALSSCYLTEGRTKEALAAALAALKVAETGYGPADAFGYEAAARIYYATEDYGKSLEYFRKALPVFLKDPSLVDNAGVLFSRAVVTYLNVHQPAEALRLVQTIRRCPPALLEEYLEPVYLSMSTADCYHALGRNDSAQFYYRQALSYYAGYTFNDFTVLRIRAIVWHRAAQFLAETRQYARARSLLDSLAQASQLVPIPGTIEETDWLLRFQVDSALGNYRQSIVAIRRYQQIHDSLTSIARNKQLAEMDVKYQTEKKNQHIADLETQSVLQANLQQATLRQGRIVRNYLIAGAALLGLLATVIYNRYLIHRRMTRRLEKLTGHQEKLLKEKEWLLREIHHRVKNNLQIVISLLRLQCGNLKDPAAIDAFKGIGLRVHSISLVHKKLYQTGVDMTVIDMRNYTRDLVDHLWEGLGHSENIDFQLDVEELYLDVTQCVPVGLILNEAITNAIKYAFPGHPRRLAPYSADRPAIRVVLREEPAGAITLLVADNGIGLPRDINIETSKTLGLQLIHTLAQQLEGTIRMASNCKYQLTNTGLTICISFPLERPKADGGPVGAPPVAVRPNSGSSRYRI